MNTIVKTTGLAAAKTMLVKMDKQFSAALPKQIPSQKFIRTIQTAISDPAIAEKLNKGTVNMDSLMTACTKAAADGLLLDGRDAALVTFFHKDSGMNVVQYIPMVDGIVKKAQNTGLVLSITREVVRENDHFEYWVDEMGSHFKWSPASGNRGKGIKAFALGLTTNGGRYIEVMDEEAIMRVAKFSKNTGQYKQGEGQWWESWWKKTVVRRVCKLMPSSTDLDSVFQADDEGFDFEQDEPVDITNMPTAKPGPKTETAAASKILGSRKSAQATKPAEKKPDPREGSIDSTATVVNDQQNPPMLDEHGNPVMGEDIPI